MSRFECVHWRTCGDDLCPCSDKSGVVGECADFESSGFCAPVARDPAKIRADLEAKREAFARLKGGGGFRFGQGAIAQKEAQRRRQEIRRLERELEESE